MTYTVRHDQPDTFLAILREVGQWLVDTQQPIWALGTLTADHLIDDYTRNNCHVLYAGQEPAAAFILQWADPLYYADVPTGTAGFIHKLAIRRQFGGQGLFTTILDFCRQECLRRDIHELQLETDATRPALLRFYERHGFSPTQRRLIEEFGQAFDCQFYVLRF